MKPTFDTLNKNYYSYNELMPNYLSGSDLYEEMGLDHDALMKQNPAYENTCATRMSLALLKSGVPFTGRLTIKSGKYTSKKIETGAKLLADQLMHPDVFGRPEFYTPENFLTKVKGRKGVVLFWKIENYGGGHIDLIDVTTVNAVCSSGCYYQSKEIWFWPLD